MKAITPIFVVMALALQGASAASAKEISAWGWSVNADGRTGVFSISHNGIPVIDGSCAQWAVDGDTVSMSDCSKINISHSDETGIFGRQKTVRIRGTLGNVTACQTINIYPDKDFFTTELALAGRADIESRYMAPISVTDSYELFDRTGNNIVFIPYDNDAWVRYAITPFGEQAPESYEVSAIFNTDTRDGLVIGSIEHDTWKTGVKVSNDGKCSIDTLKVYGGIATTLTRDVIPHGLVKGRDIKSPLVFVGRFKDWRNGMEAFGDACAVIAPKIESRGERPFGWNSWGKLQDKITYDKAIEVSDFFRSDLQPGSFENDGVAYIGLDAFWDFGFKPGQHKQFVEHCRKNGQKAGIYYCPFTDWAKNPEAEIAEMPQYKFKDAYLYGNGEVLQFDGAYALDPTHPAVKARIRRQLEEFIDWGYEYVKIDFMAHGAYEADRHFDPSVTTGVQAYSHGMKFIDDVVNGKMWINLSIAPLFPANYAHSRRIGCDSWADINNTEYTLNALTYGWWLDHMYHYNDADHIVLEGVTDGENRARVTSSAITGVYLLGDDMSHEGSDDAKRRVVRNATNPDINRMARECKSFRPVEHGVGNQAADAFCYSTPDCMYVAIFNFSDRASQKNIPLRRLGLSEADTYNSEELWSHDRISLKKDLAVEIPAKDVKVFWINLK